MSEATTTAPVINLVKGQKVELSKNNPGLKKLKVGLGWDPQTASSSSSFDLDASVILLDVDGKFKDAKNLIYFGNKKSVDGAIVHNGDNLTGAGDGDDEGVDVNLEAVDPGLS